VSRPTRGHRGFLPVRGCHPLWPDFPDGSGSYLDATGLVRVRSPLLAESRLMSFPPGTEMFQFPGFASATYGFSDGYSLRSGLPHSEIPGSKPARGSPRLFAACHVLHRLLAPRHPPDALAFLHPRQPPPQTHPARSPTVGGSWPTRTHFARARQERSGEGTVAGGFQRLLPQRAVLAWNGPHTHARCAPCPRDGKTKKKGQNARLADARHARRTKDRSFMPATGTSSPPHDVQTA
jgi:hypothetical protein